MMFPKPKIVVSKCLGFDACRYNGQTITDRFVEKLKAYVEFAPVCPEVEIGLGVPRAPIRIVQVKGGYMLYQPATERIITDDMVLFVERYLASLKDVDGFILKNRSPSCGFSDVKIYSGLDKSAASRRGGGFFGGAVAERFPGAAIEDEGRLKNFELREHFLIKLFAMARFREIKSAKSIKDLVEFHSRHKLLFLAYNQTRFRNCGRIVANHKKLMPGEVYEHYETELHGVLGRKARYTAIINTLQHALGWVSDGLSKEEKRFFLNTVEEYHDERIPLNTVLHLIHGYAVRFNNDYLLNQVLLNPYPRELVAVTDSGKGRKD